MKNPIVKLTFVLLFVLSATYLAVSWRGLLGAGRGDSDFPAKTSWAGDPIWASIRVTSAMTAWQNFILRKKAGWKSHWWIRTPPRAAGVKEHDVILTVNGNKVESVEQLRRMIREIPSGRTVAIGISRNGQPMTLKAVLADRKRAFAVGPNNFHFEVPAVPAIPSIPAVPEFDAPVSVVVVHSSVRSGLMVENLTPQLGDFLGAKNGQGVLVRSVEKGSRAEKAGFRAGDVIVKVNGEAINDSGDFGHALRGREKNAVNVNIIRDKKEQTLTLTLPERKQGRIEETLGPSVNAEMMVDLSDVDAEIAEVQPQIALAVRQVQNVKPVLEKVKAELLQQRKEIQEQVEKVMRMRAGRGYLVSSRIHGPDGTAKASCAR